MGGEFQIDSPNNAIVRANEVAELMFSQWQQPARELRPRNDVDLTPFVALASTPSTLVDALDLTLTHGVMPATMKSQIVAAVRRRQRIRQRPSGPNRLLSHSQFDYYNVWH